VGLLISVGKAENPFQSVDVLQMIKQEDRAKASWPTVKPDGLSLMAVLYPEEFLYFQSDSLVQTLKQMLNMESIQDENLFRKAS
jgi:tRNA U38,U39,U40 pseudouridine synthase TruA